MKVLFQCLGISGVILMLYGLLAFAVTQVSTPFFWTLLGLGGALTILFVWKTLSREWQAAVGAFVTLNIPWIALVVGRGWPVWAIAAVGVLSVGAFAITIAKRMSAANVSALVVIVAASYGALWYLHEKEWYKYGILAAAFVYNGIFLYVAKVLLADFMKSRSMQYGSSAAVYTIVIGAIIVVANVLSSDRHYQWDLTENKVSKLSEQSVQTIKGLKKPIQIVAFMDDRNQEKGRVKDLLNSYRYESKNFEFKFVDPDKEKQLAMQFKAKDGEIAVEFEGQRNLTAELSEEGITQAILKVTKSSNPVVCFTKGHGELDLEGKDEEPRGISALKGGLTNEGYKPKAVDSIAGGIPADCAIVAIAGPTQGFTKDEATAFDLFLEKGGKAVVMADPNITDPRLGAKHVTITDTGLEGTLEKWGVTLGKDFILEKHLKLLQGMQVEPYVIASTYGDHPIVEPFKGGKNTVFHAARSVRKKAGFAGTAIQLISSAGDGGSWAETDLDDLFLKGAATPGPNDLKGPVPVAIAVSKEPAEQKEGASATRLVVFGDADFISNQMVRSYEFNFDLFLNTLSWLQGEPDKISIRPKRIRSSTIELTPEQANSIFYVAIIGIPMLVLIFGMDLWWWRRRRG